MKAVRYHLPKKILVEDVPEPRLEEPRDAILRVTSTAICGSDLHLYNGMFPQLKPMTMGHEFMGIVEEIGPEVRNLARGDRVVVPFPIADGNCWFCLHGHPTACENSNPKYYGPEGGTVREKGGGLFGYTDLYGGYAGGQAERVRVPYADYGPRKVPDGLRDDQVLFLSDILPTGWSAIDWVKPVNDQTVAVFGCGPVGLMAMKAAKFRGAGRVIGVDVVPYRLDMAAKTVGAELVNASEEDPVPALRSLTEGRGPDVCVDAVGMEPDRGWLEKISAAIHLQRGSMKVLEMCLSAVRRGGKVSVVGVYGTSYDNFPLGQIFDKSLRLYTGQAPVHNYIDDLMMLVQEGKIQTDDIITHRLPLHEAPWAYEIFNGKQDDCVKVVLKP